jgi:acyl-CoA synthetase (AMP-forming)/AMP-acid ligase II
MLGSAHCACGEAAPLSSAADTTFAVRSVENYAPFVDEAGRRFAIPASWIEAVMRVESGGHARALSPKGAMGLMQIMPDTWAYLRPRYHLGTDPFDPHDNIVAGAGYLRELHDRFGSAGFLAAYNAGPKQYESYLAGLRSLPDETKRYITTLTQMLPDLQKDGALPHLPIASDWRAAGLFTTSGTTASPANVLHGGATSEDNAATRKFAMSPQSDGLFVSVRTLDQR